MVALRFFFPVLLFYDSMKRKSKARKIVPNISQLKYGTNGRQRVWQNSHLSEGGKREETSNGVKEKEEGILRKEKIYHNKKSKEREIVNFKCFCNICYGQIAK